MTNELTIKQAVGELKAMKEHIEPYMSVVGVVAYDMAIKALEQTRWIPCSERLPEIGEDVLVTDDVDMFVAYVIGHEWNSSDKNYDKDTPIVAWMPLPQPYKAESEVV